MKLNARPHINGNTPDDFQRVARMVARARHALFEARAELGLDVLHGRNYQHLDAPLAARQEDLDAIAEPLVHSLELTDQLIEALIKNSK